MSAIAGSVALGVGWVAQVAAQGMALPGKFEVTPTGAATYTVPIAVPPGTAGMVPSLSIAYNSQGRNGLLGMGWHLEGLPSVGRCPQTIAQDGVHGSVNYDTNDRFCLDGQRLVVIAGTYGADGTEYRTEIESFAKVVSHGTAGTGPAWFEVWTKSGQRMEFGNTTDSRVLAQGKLTARDWVVNKVSDTAGNYFSVTYVNDTTNGQVYPSRIDYTGNAGASLAPYNSVRFVYDTARPDVVPAYHAGSLQKTTVRLANVQTYAGSTLVADYRLAYEQSPLTGRSRLISLTLCTGAGACLPATAFAWQTGTLTPTVISNVAGQNGQWSGYRPYIGDFNGDGLADIMWDQGGSSGTPTSTGTRVLWTAAGGGTFTVTSNFAGKNGTLSGYTPTAIADFNRDGRSDVWWTSQGESGPLWLSTGAGAFVVAAGPPLGGIGVSLGAGSDYNADGRADFWQSSGPKFSIGMMTSAGTVDIVSHDGCAVSFPGWNNCSRRLSTRGDPDFDGDAVPDIFWLSAITGGSTNWVIWRGKGDGTFIQPGGGSLPDINNNVPYFIDLNGDGKSDIVWDNADSTGRSQGQRMLWLGKGDATFITQTNLGGQNGRLAGYRPVVGDFSGDGLADILWVQTDTNGLSTAARELWVNKGDGTFAIPAEAAQNDLPVGYVPIVADFNGDGKADILWDSRSGTDSRSTGTRVLWLSDGVAPDLMTTVTTGVTAAVAVTYKPLTDSTVYSKDSTVVDSLIDLQGPISVVARVDASNGVGGTAGTANAYVGAKAEPDGRGFVGFRQMAATDLQTGIVQTSTFRQDFPFVGLVASETKKSGTVTLNSTVHAYGATGLDGGKRFQAFLLQSQAASADLDASPLPTVTSTYQYDTYGNATQIVVSATDGHVKTTTNTYTNDTGKWLLGRLTRASVVSLKTEPGPPPSAPATTDVVIATSTNSLNLWNYLVAAGYAKAGTAGSWTVTIAGGVVIGSNSTSLPAFDAGAFPPGSSVKIVNYATIAGAGGNGGNGGIVIDGGESCWLALSPTKGAVGGPALRASVPVTIVNNGKIWSGGGGGGGGLGSGYPPLLSYQNGGSGGGGAGRIPGSGGSSVYCSDNGCTGYPGSPGTLLSGGAGGVSNLCNEGGCSDYSGGAGGNPGTSGASGKYGFCGSPTAGGAAGPAVIGNAFITWAVVGDRKGSLQ